MFSFIYNLTFKATFFLAVSLYSFSLYYHQDGVEAEVAISQMLQEGVSIQGTLAGDMAKMAVIGSITN